MAKMSRLIEVWLYINKKHKFTAGELAKKFNVSERTIQRDLLNLTEWGVPFYSETGRNGGYTMLHDKMLPPISFTEEEIASIIITYESLKQFNEIPYETEIESVVNKLLSQVSEPLEFKLDELRKHIFMKIPIRREKNEYLKEIFQAAIAKRELVIKYSSIDSEKDKKIIPLGIYSENGYWYFPAYDLENKHTSLFRSDRVLKIYETHESLKINLPELTEWFQERKLNTKMDECTVVLYVSSKVTREFSNPIFDFSKIVWNEDEWGTLTEKFSKREFPYLASVIASFGKEVKVVEPIELRNRLIDMLQETINFYNSMD